MANLAARGRFNPKSIASLNQGSFGMVCAKFYSDQRLNLANYKRGTGGRSSFNGIVATVFGNTGFVGRYVCNKLGKTGTQLILPYRGDHYNSMRLKCVGDLGQVLFHPFHLQDQKSLEEAVKYSNVVINLIGREYETKNFKFSDVHEEGARAIAKACRKMGVERLIHLSYLNSGKNPKPLVMKSPSKFKISKYNGENIIRDEFPDVTILKASDIYGQEDRFLRAICHLWRYQGKMLPLYANGEETVKQPVFVSDVAQGIVNAAQDRDTRGMTFQAIGPKRYQLCELVDWFNRILRREGDWGYIRYNMKYDPLFPIKVSLTELVSPAFPLGHLHWEGLEKESTTDVVVPGVPTLEDLGVNLTNMEDQVPWELKPLRAFAYYIEDLGEFPKPPPPKTYSEDPRQAKLALLD